MNVDLDQHGQPKNPRFNRQRNIERAVSGLLGILSGISGDQQLAEQEALFLDVWLRSQEHISEDGDLIDLLDLIGDILRDGKITSEELDDLRGLIENIDEHRQMPYLNEEAKVNQLLGILSGVTADGELNAAELELVDSWLSENSDIEDVWPLDVVKRRLRAVLADGFIDEVEKADLLELFKQITGNHFEETSIAQGMTTEFLEDPVTEVIHEGSCFCFTGKFVTGSRKTVEHSAQLRGGTTTKAVSKKIDYLVIGTLASRDWRFSSHGRKIEQVLKLRKSGVPITILTERTWLALSD